MPTYTAPLRDYHFVLNELLNIEQYSSISGFEDTSLLTPIMDEGARYCQEVLFPLNQTGDEQGLTFEDGNVTLPEGFKEAYQTYVEGGWPSFNCDTSYGGQGLPNIFGVPMTEMICSANISFGLFPGLTHGAYNALVTHANDELKQKFLPKMVSGEWCGVMCLTEPQAGTDLGLMRTKAEPNNDGSYNITGNKIFISGGKHDAAKNIIHLVLARTPDAPEGSRGISLFVLPEKHIDKADGPINETNGVVCSGIEHKMGLHASPTCVINYDNAKGWLVGEENRGLPAMFTMMNEARLLVGVQGLGVAEVAYQNALEYAKERLQGRALNGATHPNKVADPITVHPDVRRMLLTMRAFTEGSRALAMKTSLMLDISHRHEDKRTRRDADDFVQLATPVVKAYLTDGGSETANLAVQCLGGYGYIREYGLEQYIRDVRITQIYEGTNGIQALDLVGRKMGAHTGRYLRSFTHPCLKFIEDHKNDKAMAEFTKPLYIALKSLQNASLWIAQKALANPDEAAGASVDYLKLLSLTMMADTWARTAKVALEASAKGEELPFYESKLATARFFMNKILPEHYSLLAKITAGVKQLDIPDLNG